MASDYSEQDFCIHDFLRNSVKNQHISMVHSIYVLSVCVGTSFLFFHTYCCIYSVKLKWGRKVDHLTLASNRWLCKKRGGNVWRQRDKNYMAQLLLHLPPPEHHTYLLHLTPPIDRSRNFIFKKKKMKFF